MERYVEQLVADIAFATENVDEPYCEGRGDIWAWVSDEEEERTAPRRRLEVWTGITKAALPPVERLNDDRVHRLCDALKKMATARRGRETGRMSVISNGRQRFNSQPGTT